MNFLFQIEARTLPPKARELSRFKSGLLQVFHCCATSSDCVSYEGMWIVPEEELVPSLFSDAASHLVAKERDLSALPEQIVDKVKAHTEEHNGGEEGTEVAGWDELGAEVPQTIELYLAMVEEGLVAKESSIVDWDAVERGPGGIHPHHIHYPAWSEWWKMCFGEKEEIEPKDMLAQEHRAGMGNITFPKENYSSDDGYIKLCGWMHWFQDHGGDVSYPMCPDCKVKMTAPLMEFRGSEEKTNWCDGYEEDATALITLCPKCQRVVFHWHQDIYSHEVQIYC